MITVSRYHDISCGHRVSGHESKCANLHGHNYRVHFTVAPVDSDNLDRLGRVVDFSIIKVTLCSWLETYWDHKFLIFEEDPIAFKLKEAYPDLGIVVVPFNPTAENMAKYLVNHIAPKLLHGHGVRLVKCRIDETRKCSTTYNPG